MAVLTEQQIEAINSRIQAIQDMHGTASAMVDLLNLVKSEARDESGDREHPWLDADPDLSVAITLWNEYKSALTTKLNNIP